MAFFPMTTGFYHQSAEKFHPWPQSPALPAAEYFVPSKIGDGASAGDMIEPRSCQPAMKEFAYIHEEGTLPEPLDRIPFFASFQGRHLNDILYSSYFIQADAGDEIIREGQDDSRIFILLTGKLEVAKKGEVIAVIEKPGEIFGELSAISDEKRFASVIATGSTLCLVIDQQFLREIKPEEDNASYYAALYGFISRVLAARLKKSSELIVRLEKELEELKASH